MSWSSLPDDVVEVILADLSLVDLARVSTTCGSFQAMYRRVLAFEHEARCGLAADYFGGDRIPSFTALFIQALTGERLEDSCYDCRLGAYDPRTLTVLVSPRTSLGPTGLPGDTIDIDVDDGFPTWKGVRAFVPQDRKVVQFFSCPRENRKDVEVLALVQAILSEGLAQFIHDAGKSVEIYMSRSWCVRPDYDVAELDNWSREILKREIGPLMQLASRCTCLESPHRDWGTLKGIYLRYRLDIGEVDPVAAEETA